MNEVNINKQAKLSPHFTLGELTKTSYHTSDGNIPSHVVIENLKRICGWLEILRERYNKKYGPSTSSGTAEIPVIISSGYRSEEVNQKCGGAKGSNHLTGCAVDIRCLGPEQMIRYACLLLVFEDKVTAIIPQFQKIAPILHQLVWTNAPFLDKSRKSPQNLSNEYGKEAILLWSLVRHYHVESAKGNPSELVNV